MKLEKRLYAINKNGYEKRVPICDKCNGEGMYQTSQKLSPSVSFDSYVSMYFVPTISFTRCEKCNGRKFLID